MSVSCVLANFRIFVGVVLIYIKMLVSKDVLSNFYNLGFPNTLDVVIVIML